MSLLEDIFLQDEAGEAEELERVIEGDEDDEQIRPLDNSDDDSEKEDEAEEEKRRVDPTQVKEKRVIKNPRFILNPARLTGPRGIQVIPEHFKDFKFKGKGHEKEDLDIILKKLEHWAYRLYPKFQFEDCLKKIETLGKKRPVMVHLHKIRTDQFMSEETVVQKDSSDDDETPAVQEEDEFDKLLQQQINLARATPAPGSVRKGFRSPGDERSPITMPKATSSPSISNEQRKRMLKNRQMAEERRQAKLKQTQSESNCNHQSEDTIISEEETNTKKNNRSRIMDSSDEECDMTTVKQSISVDVHVTSSAKDSQDSEDIHENTSGKDTELKINDKNEDSTAVTTENSVLLTNSGIDSENKLIDQNKDTADDIEIVDEKSETNNRYSMDIHNQHSNDDISLNIVTNNEKADSNNVTFVNMIEEEIMDVDFSEVF